jgi:eukaryotic-like serine/threonine-protein kinase
VKLFDVDLYRDTTGVQAVLHEAAAGMRCRSPHVVRYDRLAICPPAEAARGEAPCCYLVREYVAGSTPGPQVADEQVTEVLRDLADGLRDMHAMNLVHRDIKPNNAIVGESASKWLDLGQARLFGSRSTPSQVGLDEVRKQRIVPPEVLRGEPWNRPGDVFSLGVTFFYVATGHWPFRGPPCFPLPQQTVDRLNDCQRLTAAQGSLILLHMLRDNPADRFQMDQISGHLRHGVG